jgi:hypothetical protein
VDYRATVLDDQPQRVFRVTLRGRFRHLTDQARRYLVKAQPEHDIFRSGYTAEGTFTYDAAIDFFNLRYEVRAGGDSPAQSAAEQAQTEAHTFLATMGFGHGDLKADVVDMSAMWAEVDLRRRR